MGVHGLTSAKRSGRSGSLADTEEGDDTDVVEEGLRLTRAITECAVAAKGRKGSRAEMAVVRAQVCGGTGGAHVSKECKLRRLSTRSEGAVVRALGEKHMIQEVLQCRNVARRVQ